jgi:hypothetical protein
VTEYAFLFFNQIYKNKFIFQIKINNAQACVVFVGIASVAPAANNEGAK